ncbi:hypothetical protein CC85DRAFT_325262 [Cutaneotrichosporon oleaginosum]|uniref:Phosphatidic acid phosphatase type 2/haloperoxidase domain-containing protein n=1 Tax=Cutaneotrichosporon oleaginosum TaxID=879819 RepID=A0A0J1BD75_9TREE|nr:uncharacterized protein CC85DRAFT_325262 [Cutaneotrichosporon oleaginosum]KLT46009.1 hypothetical protein CC85DRAFT_325262 [Cutaneotrichosporon oleaginosum]TXT06703.1 hypothetical protein COLE_06034 [Cutaneotrichosporon oleaginosum]
MGSLTAAAAVPAQKHFALTHIVYDASPLGALLALLSLSPIFLFVAYFALVVFGRRLSLLLLAAGSVANEALSLALKRALRAPRPFPHLAHVGHGYGMPSSHAQAGAFVLAWGVGYAMSLDARYSRAAGARGQRAEAMRRVRVGIYLFGLAAWSVAVAYSRYALRYHSIPQIAAGYAVGLVAGAAWYVLTEHIARTAPESIPGRIRRSIEWLWIGLGGIGGWQLGGAEGGWLEGWMFGVHDAEHIERKAQ